MENKPMFKYVPTVKRTADNFELGSPDDIASHVKSSEVGYEHIDGTCVPYMDFDAVYKDEATQEANMTKDMDKWHAAVDKEFAETEAVPIWFESHGHNVSKDVFKNSAHCVVRGAGYFECGTDVFNSFSPQQHRR